MKWECEIKRASFSWIRGDPNPAAVLVRDFFAKRQPDSRPGVFLFSVQPLKYQKYFFVMLGRNADSIISNRDDPMVVAGLVSDMDL